MSHDSSRAAAFILCLLALATQSAELRAQGLSPGAPCADHAFLDNPGACRECNESGRKIDEARCLACHEGVARGLPNDDTLVLVGGRLPTEFLAACGVKVERKFGER